MKAATRGALGPDARATRAQQVEVSPGANGVVFGRAPGAGIALPFAHVSASHARLLRTAGSYAIEDLGSANGTRLAGRKLAPHAPVAIAYGEVISFGDVEVCFEGESLDAAPVAEDMGTQTLARRLVHDLFEVGPPAEPARILVLTGEEQGREVSLPGSGRNFIIGRGEDCDLILPDPDVSREHLALQRGAGGFLARDLDSKNGVEVAGEPLVGERPLRDGELVRIGDTRLRFLDPEERYLRQLVDLDAEPEAVLAKVPPTAGAPSAHGRLPLVAAVVAVAVLIGAGGLLLALVIFAYR